MGTAQASGIALLIAAERGLAAATHTPTEVKAAVTGYGAADKRQVQAMVARVLRLDELPQPADAADALALALCHAWRGGTTQAPAGGSLTPAQRAWAMRSASPADDDVLAPRRVVLALSSSKSCLR